MKITLDFDYAHELIKLLKELGSNLKEDEPILGKEYKFEILDEFKTLNSDIKEDEPICSSVLSTKSLGSKIKGLDIIQSETELVHYETLNNLVNSKEQL